MLLVLAPLVGRKILRASRPIREAVVARERFAKPTSRRLRFGKTTVISTFSVGWGAFCDLQACNGVAVWIGGRVVGDGLDDSRCDYVYGEERSAERRIKRVDVVHVADCIDEGWDVDLVKIEAPDAVEVSFDARDGIDAESGRGLDILPGNHGDVLLKGPKI